MFYVILIELVSFIVLSFFVIGSAKEIMQALITLQQEVAAANSRLSELQTTANAIIVLVNTPDVTEQQVAAITDQVKAISAGIASVNASLAAVLPPVEPTPA